MPTYEFTCPQGHDFDKFFRSMASAPTVVPCPVCGEAADRQMSAGAGLVFHGSGFYITDYGKDGKKDQQIAAAKTSDAKNDSGGDSKSTDASKPESKSDSGTAGSKSEAGSSGSSSGESGSGDKSSSKAPDAPAKAVTPLKTSE